MFLSTTFLDHSVWQNNSYQNYPGGYEFSADYKNGKVSHYTVQDGAMQRKEIQYRSQCKHLSRWKNDLLIDSAAFVCTL
jgi:hypothetical protein